MRKRPIRMKGKRTAFGLAIEEGLLEVVAWQRGEIELETRIIEPMTASRVKAIRKAVAKNPRVRKSNAK